MAAIAYVILQQVIIASQGRNSLLKKAIGKDWKGELAESCLLAIPAALAALGGASHLCISCPDLVDPR